MNDDKRKWKIKDFVIRNEHSVKTKHKEGIRLRKKLLLNQRNCSSLFDSSSCSVFSWTSLSSWSIFSTIRESEAYIFAYTDHFVWFTIAIALSQWELRGDGWLGNLRRTSNGMKYRNKHDRNGSSRWKGCTFAIECRVGCDFEVQFRTICPPSQQSCVSSFCCSISTVCIYEQWCGNIHDYSEMTGL